MISPQSRTQVRLEVDVLDHSFFDNDTHIGAPLTSNYKRYLNRKDIQ
jgi:hypothetical protein